MELEMTGLTRNQAARVIVRYFHTEHEYVGGTYDQSFRPMIAC